MAVDLFSIVLSSAIGWGVNQLLNTAASCLRCGTSQLREVENTAYNALQCVKCPNGLKQYTNATPHTVSQRGAVTAAHISNITWPKWKEKCDLSYDLDVGNSKYQAVAIQLLLSRFRGDTFYKFEYTLKPTYETTRWKQNNISIPHSLFPEQRGLVAVDLEVYNLWGDLLARGRELMDYKGRSKL